MEDEPSLARRLYFKDLEGIKYEIVCTDHSETAAGA